MTPEIYLHQASTSRDAVGALKYHAHPAGKAEMQPKHRSVLVLHARWYRAYVMVEINDRPLTDEEAAGKNRRESEIRRIAAEYGCTASFDGDVRGFLIRIFTPDGYSDNMGGGIGLI